MSRRPQRYTYPITVLDAQGRTLWTGHPATDTSWEAHAACRPHQAEAFFPVHGAASARARAACTVCPVRFACLESAVDAGASDGIWGGLSARSGRFKRLRRDRQALARSLGTDREAP